MADKKNTLPVTGLRRLEGFPMIILLCLILYTAVVLLAYLFQDRMIYIPNRTGLEQIKKTAHLDALKLWPEESGNYRGFIAANPPLYARGTVVVFHGNAGSADDRSYYLPPLQDNGFRVILAEYPGYGARTGRTGEASFVADGMETVRTAQKEFGSPFYLWGESLGCGVVSALAKASTTDDVLKIDGIILLTPWDTLPETAQAHYWFLPARWLVRDQYDNISNLKPFSGPVAVLMAGRDKVIPNRLTLTLYRSISSPKRLWTFENARHNSWPIDPALGWWNEVAEFITGKHPAQNSPK